VADGTLKTHQRGNIEERRDAGSLMPSGITAFLDTTELRDLINYLTSGEGILAGPSANGASEAGDQKGNPYQ
jgi:hypothetical protein